MIKRKGNIYRLDTLSTTLIIRVGESAEYLYYGEKLNVFGSDYDRLAEGGEKALRLFSAFGNLDVRRASVACALPDGSFSLRFRFKKAEYAKKPELSPLPAAHEFEDKKETSLSQTLCLQFEDEASKVRLFLYYTVYSDSDAIVVSARLFNAGKKEIRVRNLASLQLDVAGDGYSFVTFRGALTDERNKVVTPVTGGGMLVNESVIGSSSHQANPFVMLTGERGVYAFNLIYSGNHKETADLDYNGRTRVTVGINDFMLDKRLKAGESFAVPEAVMTFAVSEDKASLAMHDFAERHVIRRKWFMRERPILVNNREGAYFGGEKILSIAEDAAGLGIELFVLGDGWFGHRNDDRPSLGDRFDFEEKTGGIARLADGVRGKGLKFGIWVEPEMISEDSELFREHPEYAMRIQGKEPVRMRNRLMLDLTDAKVQKYLIRVISAVISDTKAAYVKWDYNRFMSDCQGAGGFSGEYFLDYMTGLYTVVSKITERFPNVLFEGCASGGGRFDLGMLFYMPQIWTSDNTDASMRLSIQSGTSYGYPQSAISAHVSSSPNHQTGNISALETRFNIAAFGAFGYEADLTKLTERERETVKRQIEFYKFRRELFQFGTFYRLGDPFEGDAGGFMVVSENKQTAIATVAVRDKKLGKNVPRVRFKGLDEGALYEVSCREQDNYDKMPPFVLSGEVLNKAGLPTTDIFCDRSEAVCANPLYTRMYVFEKLKGKLPHGV